MKVKIKRTDSTSAKLEGKLKGKSKYVTTDNAFYPQNRGEISESITQNWTEQALECYRLNCDCGNCSISKGDYSFACQMPKVLDILINSCGKPVTT